MPARTTRIEETQIIKDILRQLRRHRANAIAQEPIWTHNTFTAPATYQLTYIPYGINALADNGSVLSEGTDYTVDYSTGLITFAVGRTAGHVIHVSYVTNGDLVAASGPLDTGKSFNVASTATATSTTIAVFVDNAVQVGDLLIFAAAGYASSGITADPTGWTRIGVARGTGTSIPIDVGVWWKIATSGDIGVVSSAATFPNSDQHIGIILAYSGYSAVRSSTLSGGSVAAGSSITTPTLSATSGDAVISLWAGEGDASPAPAFTIDAADTSRANVAMNFPRLMLGDEIAAGGTTTARTSSVTGGGNVSWASAQIAIY